MRQFPFLFSRYQCQAPATTTTANTHHHQSTTVTASRFRLRQDNSTPERLPSSPLGRSVGIGGFAVATRRTVSKALAIENQPDNQGDFASCRHGEANRPMFRQEKEPRHGRQEERHRPTRPSHSVAEVLGAHAPYDVSAPLECNSQRNHQSRASRGSEVGESRRAHRGPTESADGRQHRLGDHRQGDPPTEFLCCNGSHHRRQSRFAFTAKCRCPAASPRVAEAEATVMPRRFHAFAHGDEYAEGAV